MSTEEIALRNGGRAPRVAVATTMMSLRALVDKASGDGIEALGYGLACYDLVELCKSASYAPNCFGPNRQKLLDAALVTGEATGPLRVHEVIRDVVQSAMSFDPTTGAIALRDPTP